jgi:SAM-dependent methyltransferase
MSTEKEWFTEWFDSPYYHMLYQNRDDREAQVFLDNLTKHFHVSPATKIVDLACGKGRHAIYLNSLGFDVTGIDLSEQSIACAMQHTNAHLRFEVGDLRNLRFENAFDVALNLFTSFGYFQSNEENLQVIKNMHSSIKPGGYLLIDFMNAPYVIKELVEHESKTINGIKFKINRWIDKGFIYKKIHFTDMNKQFEFTEKVQALTKKDFELLFASCSFNLVNIFGDYSLNPYKEPTSPRLIMVVKRYA